MTSTARRFELVHFDEISGTPCPCGMARRAFEDVTDYPATVHRTEIHTDARKHYHRGLTETYYILECQPDATMELDDEIVPVSPGTCVLIRPGVRHRAVGRMTALIFVLPKFDAQDEWFD